jgi:integrase
VREVVGPRSAKQLCPIFWWRKYEELRNQADTALVQRHESAAGKRRKGEAAVGPLRNGTINAMVKRRAEEAGLVGNYGSHSLRRSGATQAAAKGIAREVLEAAGDWARQSAAMEQYICPSKERVMKVGEAFSC